MDIASMSTRDGNNHQLSSQTPQTASILCDGGSLVNLAPEPPGHGVGCICKDNSASNIDQPLLPTKPDTAQGDYASAKQYRHHRQLTTSLMTVAKRLHDHRLPSP